MLEILDRLDAMETSAILEESGQREKKVQDAEQLEKRLTELDLANAERLSEVKEANAESAERLLQDFSELREANAESAGQLSLRITELRDAANRHDMAIEDLLDTWEELQGKQEEKFGELSSAVLEAAARERREAEKREKALLDLVICSQDIFFNLRRAAAASGKVQTGQETAVEVKLENAPGAQEVPANRKLTESWIRQLDIAEQKLAGARLPAGFLVVGEAGVPVNFDVHEIVEVLPTEKEEKSHTVAEVYAPGYVYMGRVLRKAQISAFRYENIQKEPVSDRILRFAQDDKA